LALLPKLGRVLSLRAGLHDQLRGGTGIAGVNPVAAATVKDDQGRMERNDPYLILLRRELTRAQARLRRAERERDRAIAALERVQRANGKVLPRRPAKRKRAKRA
jgi:hypothetical protein